MIPLDCRLMGHHVAKVESKIALFIDGPDFFATGRKLGFARDLA